VFARMTARLLGRVLPGIVLAALTATMSAAQASAAAAPATTDWSTAVVNSTMTRFTPATLGGWSYTRGLYLYGQYLVYQRTHDPRYLAYIKGWADRFVDSSGHISQSFNSLDSMESGNVLLALFKETGDTRYQKAAEQIRARLNTYPRTSDGGFWHATGASRAHQLWLDGTFMLDPFLIRYGQLFGDSTFGDSEASHQLLIDASHLQDPSGLLFHAFDESGAASWADPRTHHSPVFWCRAIGWYGMAATEILELLPATHPNRAPLVSVLQRLVGAIARYQDPASGRWFQVVNRGSLSTNWTETSCSAMFTYVVSRAVERGYVDASLKAVASRGYQGVLARISLDSHGLTNLTQICIGTNVSARLSTYLSRPRATNDFHGLGAFLIMNEQLMRTGG
jgi:unsaturated rhamnogalacturonyl hydrolase